MEHHIANYVPYYRVLPSAVFNNVLISRALSVALGYQNTGSCDKMCDNFKFQYNSGVVQVEIFTGGPQAAVTAAIIGGVLLAMIEGISIGITRMGAEQFKPGLCLFNQSI